MGNIFGGSKGTTTKIMNIKGETTKHKTPIQAMEITKHHPGHVLVDTDAVNRFGPQARPVDPIGFLEPKKVYLLVEPPKLPLNHHNNNRREPRRVRSSGGIHVSAKDRLESLMLSRRTVSDLSVMKAAAEGAGTVRIRLPKAEVERLVKETKDKADAAVKIVGLCMEKTGSGSDSDTGKKVGTDTGLGQSGQWQRPMPQPRRGASPLGRVRDGCKKRVGFLPVNEGEIRQLAIAS